MRNELSGSTKEKATMQFSVKEQFETKNEANNEIRAGTKIESIPDFANSYKFKKNARKVKLSKEEKLVIAHLKAEEELVDMLYGNTLEEPEEVTKENEHEHRASLFQGKDLDNKMGETGLRRTQSLSSKIKQNMAVTAKLNKSDIHKFDKFCATIVTVMYLCYPVLIKSTFQLVACMPVGKNTYLQRDLNIRCWEKDESGNFTGIHFSFVLYLFLPGITLWVIGMPCEFFIEDFHFAFFVLFTTAHNSNFFILYFHSVDLHYIAYE